MKVLHSFQELQALQEKVVYALGTFDGVHKGHQAVIRKAAMRAIHHGAKLVVLTFDAHPFTILAPEKVPPALCQGAYKEHIMQSLGVDYLLKLHMDRELLGIEPETFLEMMEAAGEVKAIVTGANFTFGRKGRGTPDLIRQQVAPCIEVIDLSLMGVEDIAVPVSSTVIRRAVQEGRLEDAEALLGRPYSFTGTVITGDRRGRKLGYPTLNFLFPKELTLPPDGVYVNRVKIGNRWYGGVGNMGDNPTFENQYHRFEVHIFDFNDNVYGQEVTVEFLSFIREELKFDSLEGLIAQMKEDTLQAKSFLQVYVR